MAEFQIHFQKKKKIFFERHYIVLMLLKMTFFGIFF